jgi:hypothetical protein
VVRTYDFGDADGIKFIGMEFIGDDLEAALPIEGSSSARSGAFDRETGRRGSGRRHEWESSTGT